MTKNDTKNKLIVGVVILLALFSFGFLDTSFFPASTSGATTMSVSNVSINGVGQYVVGLAINGGSDSTSAQLKNSINSNLSADSQITNDVLVAYSLKKEICGYKANTNPIPYLQKFVRVKTYENSFGLFYPMNIADCVLLGDETFYVDDWGNTDFCYAKVNKYRISRLHSPFIDVEVGIQASNDKGETGRAALSNTIKSADLQLGGESIGRADWLGVTLNTSLCPSEGTWYLVEKDNEWRVIDEEAVQIALSSQSDLEIDRFTSGFAGIPILMPEIIPKMDAYNSVIERATVSSTLVGEGINNIVSVSGSQLKLAGEDMFAPLITLSLDKDFVGVEIIREKGKPELFDCSVSNSNALTGNTIYARFKLKNAGEQNGSFAVTVDCPDPMRDGFRDYGQLAPNQIIDGSIGFSTFEEDSYSCTITARDRDPTVPVATCGISGRFTEPIEVPICTGAFIYNPATNRCVCNLSPDTGYTVDYENCRMVPIPASCSVQPKMNEILVFSDSPDCYTTCRDGFERNINNTCVLIADERERPGDEECADGFVLNNLGVCISEEDPIVCEWYQKKVWTDEYIVTLGNVPFLGDWFGDIPLPIVSDMFGKNTVVSCETDYVLFGLIGLGALGVIFIIFNRPIRKKIKRRKKKRR